MNAVAGAIADLKRHSDKMILLGMTPSTAKKRSMAISNSKSLNAQP